MSASLLSQIFFNDFLVTINSGLWLYSAGWKNGCCWCWCWCPCVATENYLRIVVLLECIKIWCFPYLLHVRCLITCDAFPVGLFYISVALSKSDLCHYCALKFLHIFFLHTVVHALLSYKLHPREYLHLLNSRIGIWTIIFLSVFINFFAPYKDFVNIFLISGITFTPHTFLCIEERKRH